MGPDSRPPLRLAVAQFDAVAGDLGHNSARQVELLRQVAALGATLTLFPELSVTGYCAGLLDRDAGAWAVDPDGAVLAELRAACADLRTAAIVGAPTRGLKGLHLSSIVIGRSGEILEVYDKTYIDPDERRWFRRGTGAKRIELDGWSLGLGICYDSSFPEHARKHALAGADAYLVSGAFPPGRSDARRRIYFPARALENTIYVAFSNYVGGHDGQDYGGMSALYGTDGNRLADAGAEAAGIAVTDLESGHLRETRQRLQMLRDCGA